VDDRACGCSLPAHELAHALVAKRNKAGVCQIALWVLGGYPNAATALSGRACSPQTAQPRFRAGPLTRAPISGGAQVRHWRPAGVIDAVSEVAFHVDYPVHGPGRREDEWQHALARDFAGQGDHAVSDIDAD
jgi:hypothetical protein